MRALHRPSEVEAQLRAAFSLNPFQVETQIAWCQFRAGEQDLAGAWRWLQWALARAPDHAEANNMLGILQHKEGRPAAAVAAFEARRGAWSSRGFFKSRQRAARYGTH